MPQDRTHESEKGFVPGAEYEADPLWRNKLLTPAQLLVHDVRLQILRSDRKPLLEINERTTSSLIPSDAAVTSQGSLASARASAKNEIEKQKFARLEHDYGWMRHLRLTE